MTPKGVEHDNCMAQTCGESTVKPSMTPKGVEHMDEVPNLPPIETCETFHDAERR